MRESEAVAVVVDPEMSSIPAAAATTAGTHSAPILTPYPNISCRDTLPDAMWIPVAVAAGLALLLLSQGSSSGGAARKRVPRPRNYDANLKDGTVVRFAQGQGSVWPVASVYAHLGEAPHRLTVPYITETGGAADGVSAPKGVNLARAFHASRDPDAPRFHAAIDVFAEEGDIIRAVDDGVVQGTATGYVGLGALVIDHPTLTIVYAEFLPDKSMKSGVAVKAGQRLGVATPSKSGPDAPKSTMLHFETWERGKPIGAFTAWSKTDPAPPGLLDPTAFLLRTAGREIV